MPQSFPSNAMEASALERSKISDSSQVLGAERLGSGHAVKSHATPKRSTHIGRFFAVLAASSALATAVVPMAMPTQARAAELKGAPGTSGLGGAGSSWGGFGNGGGGGSSAGFVSPLPVNGVGSTGQNASTNAAGGSGGAVGGTTISAADTVINGGIGGTGAAIQSTTPSRGAGGGGGGAGLYLSGSAVDVNTHTGLSITGGKGGRSGIVDGLGTPGHYGGGGGGGGAGVVLNSGNFTNVSGAKISGGAGGNTLTGNTYGQAGAGGDGIAIQNGTFVNTGHVQGGEGGYVLAIDGTRIDSDVRGGFGGAGIRAGDNVHIINSGTVSAGHTVNRATPTGAIEIVGNDTTLELRAGSNISGNVVVADGKTGNTLVLGGDATSSFAANEIGSKYKGFDGYKKTGSSKWTLTGATGGLTSWLLEDGTLSLSQSGSLGSASSVLTIDGGTLETAADFNLDHDIVLGARNGTIDTLGSTANLVGQVTGSGQLIKDGSGKLIATNELNHTGGTTIRNGVLQVGDGSISGAISGDVAVDTGASLEFNHLNIEVYNGRISGEGLLKIDSPGGLTLTGDSSAFTGKTEVIGTLTVNGTLGGSALLVEAGADLAGSGRIMGDTTISNTGMLVGEAGKTLSFDRNLSLAAGSLINVGLGQPDDGALFNVAGDLTLKGTMNVSSVGGFGAGLYRIFDYSGQLLNAGSVQADVSFGSTPSGVNAGDLTLVTHTANQVSIISTVGVTSNFWDGSAPGGGSISGGSGTWSASASNWTESSGTASDGWDADDYAIFMTTGGVVTVDNSAGQIQASGMSFNVDGYRVTGDPLVLASQGSDKPIVRVGDGTLAGGSTMTATIDSELQGTKGLKKTDYGTLVLTGENSYTGGTEVQNGTLQIGDGGTTGSVQGDIVVGNNDSDDARLVYNRSDNVVASNVISGTGSLEQKGSGTLILTGDNHYMGGTKITDGVLQVGNGGATGTISGEVDINAGSKLVIDRDGTLMHHDAISGGGQVVQQGPGTTILGGDNSYRDGTVITAGVLQVGADRNLGDASGNVTIDGGTLQTSASFDTARNVELGTGNGTIDTQGNTNKIAGVVSGDGQLVKDGTGTLILTGENTYAGGSKVEGGILQIGDGGANGDIAGDVDLSAGTKLAVDLSKETTLDGVISGDGGLLQQGSGTTILTGENSYKGGTEITDGVLQITADMNLGDARGNLKIDGGTLQTTGSFGTTRSIELGSNNGTIDTLGNMYTIGSAVSGDGALIKEGSGTLLLTGDNTYTGGSKVKEGTLQIGSGGTGSIKGDVDLNSGTQLVVDLSTDLTLDGQITGAGDLIQQGPGVTTLTNANTYSGETTISDGELRLLGNGSIENSSRVNLDAILDVSKASDLNVNIQSIASTENGILILGDKHLNITDAKGDTFAGVIEGDGGSIELQKGEKRLTGENTYSGGTSINDGATLIIGDGGTKGSVQGDIAVEGTLIYDRSDRYTVNPLSGDGDLNLQGGGTAVIDSKQQLTGEIGIDAGNTLALEGAGDISAADGVRADGTFDVAGVDSDDVRIGHLRGEESGQTHLGDKNLVITNGNGSEFAGVIDGSGGFIVEKGKQILSGDNTYTGDTQIKAGGELQLGNENRAGSITSNVIVDGVLSGNGSMNDLLNRGVVSPGTDDSFGTLTANGNYISEGGKLVLHVPLGDDSSKGDRLVVAGNTSGTTDVTVINRNGLGAQTVNGIKVIEVGGQSDGQFNLNGDYVNYRGAQAVVGGAYAYTLEKGGVEAPVDGNWYLRSEAKDKKAEPEYQVGVPLYGSSAAALARINRGGFASFGSRMNAGQNGDGAEDAAAENPDSLFRSRYFWGRVQGGYSFYTPNGDATGSTYGSHDWTMQAGLDGQFADNGNGSLFGSVWLDYTRSQISVWSGFGDGKVKVNGYGLGGALTWYGANGFYLDGQGKVTWYKSDFESARMDEAVASDVSSFGYALSLEAGKRFALTDRWSVTPQAQLIWSSLNTDGYRDVFDAYISTPDNNSLTGRIGLAANYGNSWQDADGTTTRLELGGVANLYRELKSGANYITVSDTRIATGEIDKTWGELGVTANYSWLNDKYAVYGKLSGATSLDHFNDSYSVTGNLGFRVKW